VFIFNETRKWLRWKENIFERNDFGLRDLFKFVVATKKMKILHDDYNKPKNI
jgi:hypothetical protein